MNESLKKQRIIKAFSSRADNYDSVATVQRIVASKLAKRIKKLSLQMNSRILEIGCGTGFLSTHLIKDFSDSKIMLTDISSSMLDKCRINVGDVPQYRLLDGEYPEGINGSFDLIASNLTFQWFCDLQKGIERLCKFLAPNGSLIFTTLGQKTFKEWRLAHHVLGLICGTPQYPSIDNFPNKEGLFYHIDEELIYQRYNSGYDFARTLKLLGAKEPVINHKLLSPSSIRRLLNSLQGEFIVTYHILYCEVKI
ncbi:MAG: methyltransferase domain-containing protein [Rhodospirillaceae bacterium]|jgi:malonyl-CoA O-methyltransferase|nr:methyltransferase domain-containing protein [Rhodospirillaceae bacterium]